MYEADNVIVRMVFLITWHVLDGPLEMTFKL